MSTKSYLIDKHIKKKILLCMLISWEITKNTTSIVPLFLFTLITFTLIFKRKKEIYNLIGLTNLDLDKYR